MHLLVIGSTSPAGLEFTEAALQAGHRLSLFVRTPSKLPRTVSEAKRVQVIKAGFDDIEAIRESVVTGADTIVSFAGPVPNNKGAGTPIRDFYEKLFEFAKSDPRSAINRCLILSTPSFLMSGEERTWKFNLLISMLEKSMSFAVDEIRECGALITKQPLDRLQWTLFRVPLLNNGEAKPVHASVMGDGTESMFLTRKSLSRWLIQELDQRQWVGKAPMVSNPGWL